MNEWKIEYNNDEFHESFSQWWDVTNGTMSFRAYTKESAEWLLSKLKTFSEKNTNNNVRPLIFDPENYAEDANSDFY